MQTQGDLFRGLRFFTESSGKLRLEGTVALAAKYTGLSPRSIHYYIEDGEIEVRQPGANRTDGAVKTKAGRKRNFKCLCNMAHVFRIAYGPQEAAKLCRELGVEGESEEGIERLRD
jgi:hypothetical protein